MLRTPDAEPLVATRRVTSPAQQPRNGWTRGLWVTCAVLGFISTGCGLNFDQFRGASRADGGQIDAPDGSAPDTGDATIASCDGGLDCDGDGVCDPDCENDVVQLALGDGFTCARRVDGQTQCWGTNSMGELGDGAFVGRGSPVSESIHEGGVPFRFSELAAAYHTACGAIAGSPGEIACWGRTDNGQVPGETPTSMRIPRRFTVSGADEIDTLAVGETHVCAIDREGRLYCWGANGTSQTRPPESGPIVGPQQIRPDTRFDAVSAGQGHTCAATSEGRVLCWGQGSDGRIPGEPDDRGIREVYDFADDRVVSMQSGRAHSCALGANGSVVCWGINSVGQVGDGTTISPLMATVVAADATSVTVGWQHSCAVVMGDIKCWGGNQFGTLGTGSFIPRAAPTSTVFSAGARLVQAGDAHTCALFDGSRIECAGSDAKGALGTGRVLNHSTPQRVQGPMATEEFMAQEISVGDEHACAASGSDLFCWGNGDERRLTQTSTRSSAKPVQITSEGESITLALPALFSAGGTHSCAKVAPTSVYCFGTNEERELGTTMPGEESVHEHSRVTGTLLQISAGDRFSCVRANGGTPCWGGLSGDGGGLSDALATGERHVCQATHGAVRCWGANDRGQLGLNNTMNQASPSFVGNLGTNHLAAGARHTCSASSAGDIHCWGDNRAGQVYPGAVGTLAPTPLSRLGFSPTNVGGIAAGAAHTCAITGPERAVLCWGQNTIGQLGNGEPSTEPMDAVEVMGLGDVVSISSGPGPGAVSTCALTESGEVYCWGSNEHGRLGTGEELYRTEPVIVIVADLR